MIKRGAGGGSVEVTFEVDPAVNAQRANLCGDFNDWNNDANPMRRRDDGGFTVTLQLEPGRSYRFRYLLDGERWENDWAADNYVPNEYGGDDSLVDLTGLDGSPPPVKRSAATKAVTAKKAPAKKAASAPKKAAEKAPAPKKAAAKKSAKKAAPPER